MDLYIVPKLKSMMYQSNSGIFSWTVLNVLIAKLRSTVLKEKEMEMLQHAMKCMKVGGKSYHAVCSGIILLLNTHGFNLFSISIYSICSWNHISRHFL
jgi:hypothetical protein